MSDDISFGLLTVSDRCFERVTDDVSGATLAALVTGEQFVVAAQTVVPDAIPAIQVNNMAFGMLLYRLFWLLDMLQDVLRTWCDEKKFDVVLTTGGTGFTERDVTPEATKQLLHKDAPGMATALMVASLNHTPMAMLSRLVAGVRGSTLIVNFPGSAKACKECYAVLSPVIKHCVNQLRGNTPLVRRDHGEALHSKKV